MFGLQRVVICCKFYNDCLQLCVKRLSNRIFQCFCPTLTVQLQESWTDFVQLLFRVEQNSNQKIGQFWVSWRLRITAFGHLGIQASGHLGIWASGHLGVWASGRLGIWASGHLGFLFFFVKTVFINKNFKEKLIFGIPSNKFFYNENSVVVKKIVYNETSIVVKKATRCKRVVYNV